MAAPDPQLELSGERFKVVYRLSGTLDQARERAAIICLEQTVEFPASLLGGAIRDAIVGRVEQLRERDDAGWSATISFAIETAGGELTQLLNVVFGNISLLPGIRVERLELPERLLASFRGPRWGRAGLRERLDAPQRPLLCTALKPMGLPVAELARLAYTFALGGIDIVKDDHGLADQPFAPFNERVQACAEAVERANRDTGRRAIYAPNVSAPAETIAERARFAAAAGAGALLVSPGLVGLDTMRRLADDDRIALPILAHPALQGSYVLAPGDGIGHFALFGQLARLAGADASIFPNYGGRFAFSREQCVEIVEGCSVPMGHLRPIFPTPAGGLSLERVPELRALYGPDVILLIGAGLHSFGPDLLENTRYFRRLVDVA